MEAEYNRLKAEWESGRRDRESALHLLFLAWMHWADPPCVIDLKDDPTAAELWRGAYDYFGGENSEDAEFLHIAALMTSLFPWGVGDEAEWSSVAERMDRRSLLLNPSGFPPQHFEGRGEYGEYFAHQARARSW